MANKKKITTAVVAGVTAAALALGGTFAWTSISQQAKNESAGIVNVGGRLHDDFNGENKDIYVENFTDPLNGGQPIYARIKLTEYMEVGQDAGGSGNDVNGDGRVVAVPVIDGTQFGDVTTWKTFIPGTITDTAVTCKDCSEEGNTSCTIHDHWKWTVGGKTTFMPTFNKDKDSLKADINGTYAGTNNADRIYYDDYVIYTTDSTTGANNVAFANKESVVGSIYSVIGDAYYDDDTDTEENDHENRGGVKVESETHTAKETGTATVMTMEDWIAAGSNPRNYWVYDEDGWAYWANPIMPGESTGLLLDKIEMFKNPGEKCYYSINVVAQFATVGDWENFYTDPNTKDYDVSEDAQQLLETASQNVPTMTISIEEGVDETEIVVGDDIMFTATVSVGGQNVQDTITYSVSGNEKQNTRFYSNRLYIEKSETAKVLTIIAKSSKYPGLMAMKSIRVISGPDVDVVVNGVQFSQITFPVETLQLQAQIDDPANTGLWDGAKITYSASIYDYVSGESYALPTTKQGLDSWIDPSTGVITVGYDLGAGSGVIWRCNLESVVSPDRTWEQSAWTGFNRVSAADKLDGEVSYSLVNASRATGIANVYSIAVDESSGWNYNYGGKYYFWNDVNSDGKVSKEELTKLNLTKVSYVESEGADPVVMHAIVHENEGYLAGVDRVLNASWDEETSEWKNVGTDDVKITVTPGDDGSYTATPANTETNS